MDHTCAFPLRAHRMERSVAPGARMSQVAGAPRKARSSPPIPISNTRSEPKGRTEAARTLAHASLLHSLNQGMSTLRCKGPTHHKLVLALLLLQPLLGVGTGKCMGVIPSKCVRATKCTHLLAWDPTLSLPMIPFCQRLAHPLVRWAAPSPLLSPSSWLIPPAH